jgi:hypothetical protein
MSCADCEESYETCVECGKAICSLHRYGTGELSDGYACSLGCSLQNAGAIPKPKQTLADRFGFFNLLGVFFVFGWVVVGLIHFLYWRHSR